MREKATTRGRKTAAKASTGTVTLLFTDLVNSTELLDKLGDDNADRYRRRHFRLLRETLVAFRGREVKSLGDGLMVVFSSASQAVACAVAIQQTIHDHNAGKEGPPAEVRIGLHAGESIHEEDDYFGTPVVVAKRLCDSGSAGQIIVSELVRDLVGTRGGYTFRPLGALSLKGIQVPVAASEVAWEPGEGAAGASYPTARPLYRRLPLVGVAVLLLVAAAAATMLLLSRDDGAQPSRREQAGTVDSLEGLEWIPVPHEEGVFGGVGGQEIHRLIAFHGGLVAVGRDGTLKDTDAAVWVRTGSDSWERVPPEEKVFGGTRDQLMWGVAAFRGTVIAVGRDESGGDKDAAVWTSSDGMTWKRVPHDEATFGGRGDQVMNRIAAGPDRVVAVGFESVKDDTDAAVWISENGRRWERVSESASQLGGKGKQDMRSIVSNGERFVAVGSRSFRFHIDAAIWVSDDGTKWERIKEPSQGPVLGGPADQVATTVTAGGPGFVSAGYDTSSGTSDAALWTSTDGLYWQPVPGNERVFGGLGNQFIWGMSSGPTGWLIAVGRDNFGGGPDAAMWTSLDGQVWRRIRNEDIFGGDRAQTMKWVAVTPRELIAAGSDKSEGDADAAVWISELGANGK